MPKLLSEEEMGRVEMVETVRAVVEVGLMSSQTRPRRLLQRSPSLWPCWTTRAGKTKPLLLSLPLQSTATLAALFLPRPPRLLPPLQQPPPLVAVLPLVAVVVLVTVVAVAVAAQGSTTLRALLSP